MLRGARSITRREQMLIIVKSMVTFNLMSLVESGFSFWSLHLCTLLKPWLFLVGSWRKLEQRTVNFKRNISKLRYINHCHFEQMLSKESTRPLSIIEEGLTKDIQ